MKDRSVFVLSVFVAVALFLAACGSSASEPTAAPAGPKVSTDAQKFVALQGDSTRGKNMYQTTCVSCHGPDAKGMPNLGKDLTASTFLKGLPDAEAILFLTK